MASIQEGLGAQESKLGEMRKAHWPAWSLGLSWRVSESGHAHGQPLASRDGAKAVLWGTQC